MILGVGQERLGIASFDDGMNMTRQWDGVDEAFPAVIEGSQETEGMKA